MKSTSASCCCGQLKLGYKGEVTKSSICHCFACQKRTGSVFGVQTMLEQDKVSISGEVAQYVRTGDEGNKIDYGFCPSCGTTVYWRIDHPDFLGFIAIALGTLDNHEIPAPVFSVYEDRLQKWLKLPESIVEHMA